jgi:hypothetical protein
MQDLVGGDNNRTSVIFGVPDNLVFVGGIGNGQLETYAKSLQLFRILCRSDIYVIYFVFKFIVMDKKIPHGNPRYEEANTTQNGDPDKLISDGLQRSNKTPRVLKIIIGCGHKKT